MEHRESSLNKNEECNADNHNILTNTITRKR